MTSKKLLAVVAVLLAFALGMLAARREAFPFPWLRSAWRAVVGSPEPARPDHPPGLWRPVREAEAAATPEGMADLANLPYLRGKASGDAAGITSYDPDAAQDGYNLVLSAHAAAATLLDMSGNALHAWKKGFDEVWPEPPAFVEREEHRQFWSCAHLDPSGDLLAVFDGLGMIKLDRDSKLAWKYGGRCHSDLCLGADGTIYALAREPRERYERLRLETPILEDFVVALAPDGKETARVSLVDCLLDSDYAPLLASAQAGGSLLRPTSIEVLDGRYAAALPAWRAGRVLVALSALDAVAVVDLEQKAVVWALAGLFAGPSDAAVLEGGKLLVFDSRGNRGRSRVVEIDPVAGRVVWACPESGATLLDSAILGAAQRLQNGNTLITEAEGGRALEVTPDQKIAWEYVSPHKSEGGDLIACLTAVVRLDRAPLDAGLLAGRSAGGTELDTSGVRELLEKTKKK